MTTENDSGALQDWCSIPGQVQYRKSILMILMVGNKMIHVEYESDPSAPEKTKQRKTHK